MSPLRPSRPLVPPEAGCVENVRPHLINYHDKSLIASMGSKWERYISSQATCCSALPPRASLHKPHD